MKMLNMYLYVVMRCPLLIQYFNFSSTSDFACPKMTSGSIATGPYMFDPSVFSTDFQVINKNYTLYKR